MAILLCQNNINNWPCNCQSYSYYIL